MSDAQRSWAGPGEALARVAEWMSPCATCPHPQVEHDIIDVGKKKGQRSGCLTTERAGKCKCTIYVPTEVSERTT